MDKESMCAIAKTACRLLAHLEHQLAWGPFPLYSRYRASRKQRWRRSRFLRPLCPLEWCVV